MGREDSPPNWHPHPLFSRAVFGISLRKREETRGIFLLSPKSGRRKQEKIERGAIFWKGPCVPFLKLDFAKSVNYTLLSRNGTRHYGFRGARKGTPTPPRDTREVTTNPGCFLPHYCCLPLPPSVKHVSSRKSMSARYMLLACELINKRSVFMRNNMTESGAERERPSTV